MPKKHSYLGKEYEVDAWGGITAVSSERSVKKRLRGEDIDPVPPSDKKLKSPFTKPVDTVNPVPSSDKKLKTVDSRPAPTMAESADVEMASFGGDTQLAAKETPVIWHDPQIGYTETYTTIIPTTFYLSANVLDATTVDALNKIEIRLNSPYNPLISPASFVAQTGGAARVRGVSVDSACDGATNPTTLIAFPTTMTATHKPQWLAYWEKIYESYTVLETQYEITAKASNSANTTQSMVLHEFDAYGVTSTGNVMPPASLDEMINWRGVKALLLGPSSGDSTNEPNSCKKITGTWKPGTIARNVKNDGDNKTWSSTGAVPSPSYTESLHMRCFRAPLCNHTPTSIGINFQIKLKYVVQFKDLKSVFRYPVTGGTATSLTVPADVLKSA